VARVLIDAPACPPLLIDQRSVAMSVRRAATLPLRPTVSPVADSNHPSPHADLRGRAASQRQLYQRQRAGPPAATPVAAPQRIVVLGDTAAG
jgi:hypothetical protein